jgi:RNA polymerase sigma factor (sigma-70 family)
MEMSVARRQQLADASIDSLVLGARRGDTAAWTMLLGRFDRGLRAIARSYRLGTADVDDVVQITWERLYRQIGALREPAALGGWLATTTRREAMRVLQRHVREQLSDDPALGDVAEGSPPEAVVLAAEQRAVLGRALATLSGRQRDLLTLLAMEPDADYRHISTTLNMPLGSIGPLRARGLARLRRHRELRTLHLSCA